MNEKPISLFSVLSLAKRNQTNGKRNEIDRKWTCQHQQLTAAVPILEPQMGAVILFDGQQDFNHFVPHRAVHVVEDDRMVLGYSVHVRRSVQAVLRQRENNIQTAKENIDST